MDLRDSLAGQFEENRKHLQFVAYRMLGSLSDADDAVQEAWLRLSRSDPGGIQNLSGWLTTVVARICLDMLRARRSRVEDSVAHIPDPLLGSGDGAAHEADMADSISLALLVVLDTLAPSERLAFVLHDVFDLPFEEIAAIVGKTPAAARQLASRARRRVQVVSPASDADIDAQRRVVAAFLAAAHGGDFDALLRLLDPDVVVRGDLGVTTNVVRGAEAAAKRSIEGARLTATSQSVLVNGAPGLVSFDEHGQPRAILAFTIRSGKIAEIHVLADPERVRRLWSGSDCARAPFSAS